MTTNFNEELKEMMTKVETLEMDVHASKTRLADLLKVEKGEEFELARRLANVEMEKRHLTKKTESFNDIIRRASAAFEKSRGGLMAVTGVITQNIQAVVTNQKEYNDMVSKDQSLELLSETLEKALKAAEDATTEESAGKSKASKKPRQG